MEIRFEMDGAMWRRARRALLLRRLMLLISVFSVFCVALIGTGVGGNWARIILGIAWPGFVVLSIVAWQRAGIHPDSFPRGTYTVRATPDVFELEYSVGHAWFSWDFVTWTRRSGFLVAWVRSSGVVCLPPGSFTAEQEAQLRAMKRQASGHHPAPPPAAGFDEVSMTVDNSRGLHVRARQVNMDHWRQKHQLGTRVMWAFAGLVALAAPVVIATGEPVGVALGIFDLVGIFLLASVSYWSPLVMWLRRSSGDRFSVSAGPKGVWIHSALGTTAIQWERVSQVVYGRALTAICVGAQITPIPDLSFERTLDGEAFAAQANRWREAARERRSVPAAVVVSAQDLANPFAPPA